MRDENDKALNKRVGKWLRRMRGQFQPNRDTSLGEIVKRMDGKIKIKQSALGSYERGEREPPATKLLRFARFYGFSLDAMLDDVLPDDQDNNNPPLSYHEDKLIDLTAQGPVPADQLTALSKLADVLKQIVDELAAVTVLCAVDDKNGALAAAIGERAARARQAISRLGRLLQQVSAMLEATAS
jgi:transcriptional regulator with XRE-family HTH domain